MRNWDTIKLLELNTPIVDFNVTTNQTWISLGWFNIALKGWLYSQTTRSAWLVALETWLKPTVILIQLYTYISRSPSSWLKGKLETRYTVLFKTSWHDLDWFQNCCACHKVLNYVIGIQMGWFIGKTITVSSWKHVLNSIWYLTNHDLLLTMLSNICV